jgi:cobalamin-dependent methionine synthase I
MLQGHGDWRSMVESGRERWPGVKVGRLKRLSVHRLSPYFTCREAVNANWKFQQNFDVTIAKSSGNKTARKYCSVARSMFKKLSQENRADDLGEGLLE